MHLCGAMSFMAYRCVYLSVYPSTIRKCFFSNMHWWIFMILGSLLHRLYCARSLPTNSLWATTWNDVSDSLKLPAHLMLGESALTSHCSQINVNAGREWPRPLHVNKPICSLLLFANRGAGLKLWRIFKSRLYEQNEIVWLNSISCVQV